MNKFKSSQSSKSGMSAILVVVLVFVGSFSLMLSASDPGRAWITARIKQLRFWNSTSIEKNPQLFAAWCEDESVDLKHVLNARRLELLSEKSQLRRERDSSNQRKKSGLELLDLAKETYVASERLRQWPVEFQGTHLTQTEMKSRILELDQECHASESIAQCMDGLLPDIEAQLRQVSFLLTELKQTQARAMVASSVTGKPSTQKRLMFIRDQLDALGAMGVVPSGSQQRIAPSADVLVSRYELINADEMRFDEILNSRLDSL